MITRTALGHCRGTAEGIGSLLLYGGMDAVRNGEAVQLSTFQARQARCTCLGSAESRRTSAQNVRTTASSWAHPMKYAAVAARRASICHLVELSGARPCQARGKWE